MEVGIKLLNLFHIEFIGGVWLSVSFAYVYFKSALMQVFQRLSLFVVKKKKKSFRILAYINFFFLSMSS